MTETTANIDLAPRKIIANDLVFVDGFMRSGKHMLGSVIASYERMEMWQNLVTVENLPIYHRLGKLSRDAAIQMTQIEVDTYFYYTLIGRRANFRYNDASGIWKARDPGEYFKRIFSESEASVLEDLPVTRPICLTFTHDICAHPEIPFAAYPGLRIAEMRRNPVDVAHSWLRKDWPDRIVSDPMSTAPSLSGNAAVPWFAADWAEDFRNSNAVARIVRSLDWLSTQRDNALASASGDGDKQIFSVPFELFVSDPVPWIEKLSHFLGTNPSGQTEDILRRENCPRTLKVADYVAKRDELAAELDTVENGMLDRMEEEFRVWCRAAFGTDDNDLRH